MKKLIVKVTGMKVLFALLMFGLTYSLNAQSKANLVKEFEQLNEKSFVVYEKYADKYAALDSKWQKEIDKDENYEEMEDIKMEDFSFDDESFSTKEEMTLFVQEYEERFSKTDIRQIISQLKKERKSALSEAESEMDKDYINLEYDIELDIAELENKMYLVAKSYLKK